MTRLLCLGIVTLVLASELRADPTNLRPNDSLNAHGLVPGSKELWQELVGLRQAQEKLAAKVEADQITAAGENSQLGEGFSRAHQMDRLCSRLRIFGEPSHTDFTAYNTLSRAVVQGGIERFILTPHGRKHIAEIDKYFTKTAPQRQKVLQQLIQMARNSQWVQAEKKLDLTLQELDRYGAYIGPYGRKPIYEPFNEVAGAINQKMTQMRSQQANTLKEQTFKQVIGERDELLRKLQTAATQLPQKGTVDLDGKSLEGPQAIAAFAKSWGEVHAGLLKCAALDYGIKERSEEYGYSGGSDESQEMNRWQGESQKLTEGMRQGFVNLIAADAAAAPAMIAKKHYIDYLETLGGLSQRCSNPSWMDALTPPLKQLAAKGQLQQAVEAYSSATHDLLRWRAKIATAQTQIAAKDFPSLGSEFRKRVTAHDQVPGFFSQDYHHPYMTTYVAKILPAATDQMMKVKVTAANVVRFETKEPIFMTQFEDGVYTRLPPRMRPESGVAGLVNDLMVDGDHPPLTLEAAAAVVTAQRGEFLAVGGEIAGIEVGGSVTRFASLPAIAGNFVHYDRIQPAWNKVGELSGLSVQFALMPEWASHKYFFTKISLPTDARPAPNPTAPPTVAKPEVVGKP